MVLGVAVQPFGRQHRLDDLFHHRFAQIRQLDVRGVLSGQHHRVHRHRLAVFIAQGYLALGVRTQPAEPAVLAQLRLALHQPVGEVDRRRHQRVGFVGGVAEHQALVAGALFLVLGFVDAHGDVRGLLADAVEHRAGGAVEAHVGAVVADVQNHLADDVFQFHIGAGAHFAGNDGHTGLDHGLHGHAGVGVVGDDGVEDRVRDLVGHFIRMAFGDRLGGKDAVFTHYRIAPFLMDAR